MSLDSSVFSLSNNQLWGKGKFDNTIYENELLSLKKEEVYKQFSAFEYSEFFDEDEKVRFHVDPFGLIYVESKDVLYVYDWVADKFDEVMELEVEKNKFNTELLLIGDKIITVFLGKKTTVKIMALHSGVIIDTIEIPVNEESTTCFINDDFKSYFLLRSGKIMSYDLRLKELKLETTLTQWANLEPNTVVLKVHNNLFYCCFNNVLYIFNALDNEMKSEENVVSFCVRNKNLLINKKENESSMIFLNSEKIIQSDRNIKFVNFDKEYRVFLQYDFERKIEIFKKEKMTCKNDFGKPYTGSFYLPIIDSGIFQTQWTRFRLDFKKGYNSQVNVEYFAFDEMNVKHDHKLIPLEEWYQNPQITIDEMRTILDEKLTHQIINPSDALFLNAFGRYMIIRIELWGTEDFSPEVYGMKVHFNEPSFTHYLPEIYQTGESKDFLERFMRILETLYLDIEEKIDILSNFTDIDYAGDAYLRWMTHWIDFEVDETWSTNQVRELLKSISYLYEKRGTKKAVELLLEIYLGYKPLIVENYEIDTINLEENVKKMLKDAYGDSPYGFTIFTNGMVRLTEGQKASIKGIIEKEIPAHTHYRFIELDQWIALDKQSYLNINSVISEQSFMKLDNTSILPFHSKLEDHEKL